MSYSKTRYKKRCRSFCRLKGKRCMSYFNDIYKNRCKHNYSNYWPNKEMLWSYTTLESRMNPDISRGTG
jgi:hypothetical protein